MYEVLAQRPSAAYLAFQIGIALERQTEFGEHESESGATVAELEQVGVPVHG